MPTTEFMLQLHTQMVSEKNLAENTANAYLRTLYILNNKKAFKNLAFLKDTTAISAYIEANYAESTQRTIYATLTSVLSSYKEKPGYKKTYQFYSDKMNSKIKALESVEPSKKTETQEKNWISWLDVVKKADELQSEVMKFSELKKLDKEQYDKLLHAVILALYTYIPPRRNKDFLDMVAFRPTKKDSIEELPTETNYLILEDKVNPSLFIFNVYKTAKTYGQQKVHVPPASDSPLHSLLTLYMKHHPLMKDKKVKHAPFLVNSEGNHINSVNAITRALNRIFDMSVGSSMLRHIYLSSKYNIDDMKHDAVGMGHSLSTQRLYLKSPGAGAQEPEQDEDGTLAESD
jgi:hypothetical protein